MEKPIKLQASLYKEPFKVSYPEIDVYKVNFQEEAANVQNLAILSFSKELPPIDNEGYIIDENGERLLRDVYDEELKQTVQEPYGFDNFVLTVECEYSLRAVFENKDGEDEYEAIYNTGELYEDYSYIKDVAYPYSTTKQFCNIYGCCSQLTELDEENQIITANKKYKKQYLGNILFKQHKLLSGKNRGTGKCRFLFNSEIEDKVHPIIFTIVIPLSVYEYYPSDISTRTFKRIECDITLYSENIKFYDGDLLDEIIGDGSLKFENYYTKEQIEELLLGKQDNLNDQQMHNINIDHDIYLEKEKYIQKIDVGSMFDDDKEVPETDSQDIMSFGHIFVTQLPHIDSAKENTVYFVRENGVYNSYIKENDKYVPVGGVGGSGTGSVNDISNAFIASLFDKTYDSNVENDKTVKSVNMEFPQDSTGNVDISSISIDKIKDLLDK